MIWKVINLAGSLGPYREDWDRLNAKLYGNQPFFDSRFVDPLLKFFATGNERLCIHSRDGIIDGLLILIPRRMGIWSLFTPSQAQIAPVLLENVADIHLLFTSLNGFPLAIEFQCQDPIFAATPPMSSNKLPISYDQHALTISIALQENFEDYWSSRSRKLQQNLRRYFRRAQQDTSAIRIEHHQTEDKMRQAVYRYGDLESRGWKGNQGTALHAMNLQGKFYSQIMENFSISKQASVYELYFGDHMVASRLCIHNSKMLIMLKTTYNEDLSQYSPGRLLLYLILEREFLLKRVKSVEFYTNATQDQISWGTDQRIIQHLTIFKSSLLKQMYLFRNSLFRGEK